jgi:hypothetical protein
MKQSRHLFSTVILNQKEQRKVKPISSSERDVHEERAKRPKTSDPLEKQCFWFDEMEEMTNLTQ